MPVYQPEWRRCQLCKRSSAVYQDGAYLLVKYGVRHYAHPTCLAERNGRIGGREMIPEHQRECYELALLGADEWTIQKADLVDQRAGRVTSDEMPKNGPGRPPRAGKKLSTGRIEIRVTEQEQARWQREADRRDVALSALLRDAVEAYIKPKE